MGEWHNADFAITLTATDYESGIAETYYRINNGPVKALSTDGQPLFTTEGANNTLEYWSVDNAGNEQLPHRILTGIKLDTAPPNVAVTFPSQNSEIRAPTITATWTCLDEGSGISHCEVRLDEGSWINVGTSTTYTFSGLEDGAHTFNVKAADKTGKIAQGTVNFTVNTSLIGGPGWTDDTIACSASIVAILGGCRVSLENEEDASNFTELAIKQAEVAPAKLWNGQVLRRLVEKYFIKEGMFASGQEKD